MTAISTYLQDIAGFYELYFYKVLCLELSKLNLLKIQINCRYNIRQEVEHPVLHIRNTYLNILITTKYYILARNMIF